MISAAMQLEIIAPSFLDMAHSFATSNQMIGYTITADVLGACIASLMFGPMSDSYGHKKVMIFGNLIFLIGSIIAFISPSIHILIFARFLQGFGSAASIVLFSTIIADKFKVEEAGKLYGNINAVFIIFLAIAPVFGSLITMKFGYRGNLGVIFLLSALSSICVIFFLPETKEKLEALNLKKVITDYKKLLSSKIFLSTAITPSLIYACYVCFIALAPFLYMQTFKLTNIQYALHQFVIIAVNSLLNVFSHKFTSSVGIKNALYTSMVMAFIGLIILIFARNPYLLTLGMTIFAGSSPILYPIIFSRSMEVFPEIKGTSSSVVIVIRYLMFFIFTGLTSYFYNKTSSSLSVACTLSLIVSIILTIYLLQNSELFKSQKDKLEAK